MTRISETLMHLPIFLFFGWLVWRSYRRQGRMDSVRIGPAQIYKLLLLIALCGLAGCASHEKLAVASGPTFALNQDHWQATPEDLAAPDSGK